MKQSSDLLDNFRTWPPHVQKSFLDMVSNQVIMDEETQRQANRTLLEQLMDNFKDELPLMGQKILALSQELKSSDQALGFLNELLERDELVRKIEDLKKELTRLQILLESPPTE